MTPVLFTPGRYAAHAHELHQYPDRTEQAKHGFGRCLRPPVASDVCAWPDNARAFMQGLGVAARRLAPGALEHEPGAGCFGSSEAVK